MGEAAVPVIDVFSGGSWFLPHVPPNELTTFRVECRGGLHSTVPATVYGATGGPHAIDPFAGRKFAWTAGAWVAGDAEAAQRPADVRPELIVLPNAPSER